MENEFLKSLGLAVKNDNCDNLMISSEIDNAISNLLNKTNQFYKAKEIENQIEVKNACDCKCCNKEEDYVSDKVYLFTSSAQNNTSNQIAELEAKSKSNILGFKKTKIEILDLTGKEIVGCANPYKFSEVIPHSYRMNYMSLNNRDIDSDYIAAGVGILELKENENPNEKIGLTLFSFSSKDDLDGLSEYIRNGLLTIYSAKLNEKYTIVNFHIAVEGLDVESKYATVIAGIID